MADSPSSERDCIDQVTWMGTPTFKNILDAWIYQEIIYEIQPDIIIEIGSKYGGSTKYFANLLDLLGKGMVISIDIDHSIFNLVHKRVRLLTGNSSDPKIIFKVSCICKGKHGSGDPGWGSEKEASIRRLGKLFKICKS